MTLATRIVFMDLLVLNMVNDNPKVRARELFCPKDRKGKVNEWLEKNSDSGTYQLPLSSMKRLTDSTRKLRLLGFIDPEKKAYQVTQKGLDFLEAVPAEYEHWPSAVPFNGVELDWDSASYPPLF